MALDGLSTQHCILLAAQYAADADIEALRILSALKEHELELGLLLRIILTFLPETTDPSQYLEYLHELATNSRSAPEEAVLDISSVETLSVSQARRKARKLHDALQPLAHPLYSDEDDVDTFTHFLINQSHRIDAETGLLELVPQMIVPFLHHSEYLRTWFLSTVFPLLRLGYEYYPSTPALPLEEFAQLKGKRALEYQMANVRRARTHQSETRNIARDLRAVVGPWMCGASQRKRRKLDMDHRRASIIQPSDQDLEDWECLFQWLVHTSKEDFALINSAFLEWDGPNDLDLGGYDEGHDFIGEERQRQLERRYAQMALASVYLVDSSAWETLQTSHTLLERLSNLLGLETPPDFNVAVESLPSYDLNFPMFQNSATSMLQDDHMLKSDNIITQPNRDTVRILCLFIFSASLLSKLQYPMSVRDVARLYLRSDQNEQKLLLNKIIHALSSGPKKDADQWKFARSICLWLWNWGTNSQVGDRYGQGIFGMVDSKTLAIELLTGILESSHFQLVIQLYLEGPSKELPLSPDEVEKVVLASVMHYYDNASNGNRTRGGMKRSWDIMAAFKPVFSSSPRFQRTQALLSATHAMSFYSLTLQHGVPFQPVNIRVSADPLSLIRKLLAQNHNSYTHLDDLISIGQNLTVSMPSTLTSEDSDRSYSDLAEVEKRKATAERRVIGMAIEAALEEDDFETAYSYVITRLTPPSTSPFVSPALSTASQRFSFGSFDSGKEDEADDIAWRAALQAGRYGSSSMSASGNWSASMARPELRQLEQRMELLSQTLILAPLSHLEEVLAVWQECEKEMNSLLADEADAEEKFNDRADRRLPGAFNEPIAVQPRREVGRGAVEESPMGLFDVARGAAAAFSKSAFPLKANTSTSRAETRDVESPQGRVSMDSNESRSITGGEDRVRKRDMVASAVTGGLASGLGWVLGATPVQEREGQ